MANPILDLANPIHVFSDGNLTFTAIADCYLYGSIAYSVGANRTITATRNGNSNPILHFEASASGGAMEVSPIKIIAGTTLVTNYSLPDVKVYNTID